MESDATPLVRRLLDAADQPAGLLLAGLCLAERLRTIASDLRRSVMDRLFRGFASAAPDQIPEFAGVLGAIGGPEVSALMRGYVDDAESARHLAAIRVLGQTRNSD